VSYKLLIVDDEPFIRETISDILTDQNYECISVGDGEQAEIKILTEDLGAVILDVMLPNKGGLELLDYIRKEFPLLPTIIMSGHGNIKMAVDAMKRGAFDFIEKPLSMERILNSVRNALRIRELQTENIKLRSRLEKPLEFIGQTKIIKNLLDQLPNIANSDASVLITGENGTGKEMIARLIHQYSKRKNASFIGVNSAAIPETLIESELFGHEKGAFTGAIKQKKGKFEVAHKGSIFLDEIGDLSLPAQAKVLRVLQEQELERVGGTEIVKIDVRVITATNKDLPTAIDNNEFRQDLFFRLNVIPLHIPPLRERKEDIPILVDHFIQELTKDSGRQISLSKPALKLLKNKHWPGNVRELRNFIERLIILCNKDLVEAEDILQYSVMPQGNIDSQYEKLSLREAKKDFEKGLIINRLMKNKMNITRSAESLGIERTYLHKKIKELGIDNEMDLS
jgi:two-component system nitrogen regulation response regulator NtrX